MMKRRAAALMRRTLAAFALFLLAIQSACAADPDALWKIVDSKCAPAARAGLEPKPCTSLDLPRGVAILKDNAADKPYHYLAIPTAKVTGIEDPSVLADRSFEVAWDNRALVATKLGRPLPRAAYALAVNSRNGRSQSQLHIHIDCIRPDIRAALDATPPGPAWAPFPVKLDGHRVSARLIPGDTLAGINPFRLLAEQSGPDMGDWTLVAAALPEGFALIAHNDAFAHGEAMMDFTCHGF
ncbi:MAG: CDP-diacylglycerol diphosphatase [Alphaproteobacteria bacterium]|nr:CDP-diacylglycerol diphosphatase [Alphaproteobacteria bacterium]